MSVYLIAQLTFVDATRYRHYMNKFASVFDNFPGTLLCADEGPEVLEGSWLGDKVVVMSFESEQQARQFVDSPEYQAISIDRHAGADTIALLVHGIQAPPPSKGEMQ